MNRPAAPQTFYFKAAMPDGTLSVGSLDALSQQDAMRELQRIGARPLRLQAKPVQDSWLYRDVGLGTKSLSNADCEALCRELALLLSAGLELSVALSTIKLASKKRSKIWCLCEAVLQGMRLGRGFALATEQSGFRLPRDVVPVLRAGEDSGSLPAAVKSLAETLADRRRLAGSVASAMAYPAFLLLVVLGMLAIMASFVAPALGRLFVSMNKPPPAVISALWGLSDFVAANTLAIVAATAVAVVGVFAVLRSSAGRAAGQFLLLGVPVVGGLMLWSATGRFASALKLSVVTNAVLSLALSRALEAAGIVGAKKAAAVISGVRRGTSLTEALKALGVFPQKVTYLVGVGEQSGKLAEVLSVVIDEARAETERRASLVSTLLGPLLIVLVGGAVGATVFSIFSALMEVNNLAS